MPPGIWLHHSRETSLHGKALAQLQPAVRGKAASTARVGRRVESHDRGCAAPVLLLPEGFARFTEDEVVAALCHELAHIKRQDYLMNLVCQVVSSAVGLASGGG